MGKEQEKRGLCHFCHCQCGVIGHVKDGVLERVAGDPKHPFSQGFTCGRLQKGWKEFYYHPDRLRYPLKRVGKRGENKWKEISWEQAFDEIAEQLDKIRTEYGAEAVATSSGTGRTDDWARARFFNLFGSPNRIGPGKVCFCNDVAIENAIYGSMADLWVTTFSPCIMIWGHNPSQAFKPEWQALVEHKKQGAKIISVNSTYNETSAIADIHLPLRPGTDGAMALGMLHVIINEELYDKEFVESWCYGFDKLRERVQEYPPEKVADITGVAEETIIAASRMYATIKPAFQSYSLSTAQIGRNSTHAIQAKDYLRAITGNLDVEGGNPINPGSPPKIISDYEMELNEKLLPEQRKKQMGADRYRLQSWPGYELIMENRKGPWRLPPVATWACMAHDPTLYRAILTDEPYPVKAMIVSSSNPLVAAPNTKLVYEALKKVDALVVNDYWMTPTAMLADYVTPAASWLERPILNTYFGSVDFTITGEAIMPAVVEGKHDRKRDYEFWRGLGMRLGQAAQWPWETLEEAYGYRLKPLGYGSFQEFHEEKGFDIPIPRFRKYAEKDPKTGNAIGFATPTGKVELYSTIFEKLGYDPLPHYEEPAESPVSTPELAKEYPLILSTGARLFPLFHSEHRQIKSIRQLHPDPLVEINPNTALKSGIAAGDWVYIETPRGRVKNRAFLTTAVHEKVVQARQNNWWFPEKPGEDPILYGIFDPGTVNVITDDDLDHCDPLCGGWAFRGLLCKIYKAEEEH